MAVPAVAAGIVQTSPSLGGSHVAPSPSEFRHRLSPTMCRLSLASGIPPVALSSGCANGAHCTAALTMQVLPAVPSCDGRLFSMTPSPSIGGGGGGGRKSVASLVSLSPGSCFSAGGGGGAGAAAMVDVLRGSHVGGGGRGGGKGGSKGAAADGMGSCACAFVRQSLMRSSFFDGGSVSALSLALAAAAAAAEGSGRGGGGGLLGAQMNIFQRIVRIVRSYANSIVSAAEDPEKLLDQTVLEMNEDLAKMRQASAQVLASQKQLENRYKAAETTAGDWYRRARLALEKGDEVLAKEALKRRKDYEESAKALKSQLDQQKVVVDKLIINTRLLETKIQEAKSKKDTLKARAQSAKTSQKVQQMLGSIDTSSAMAAFEKMEEKVLALESEAEAVAQIGTDDLATKFALLEGDSVDDDLAELKREMIGGAAAGKRSGGELPAGRSATGGSAPAAAAESVGPYPYKDLEIERELNELRRKAKDL